MIRMNNDYSFGMHPEILKCMTENQGDSYPGYGLDPWCDKAAVRNSDRRPG